MTDRETKTTDEKEIQLPDTSILIRTEEGIYFQQYGVSPPLLTDHAIIADTLFAELESERETNRTLREQLQSARQEINKLREERDDLIEGLLVYAEQRIGSDDDGEHARSILLEIGVTIE